MWKQISKERVKNEIVIALDKNEFPNIVIADIEGDVFNDLHDLSLEVIADYINDDENVVFLIEDDSE